MSAADRETSFNREKFKQIVHYIISQTERSPTVGKTVLYKILYFAEFDFYELYERKLTGERYFRLEFGPGPEHFDDVLAELEDEGKVTQFETQFRGFSQNRWHSNEEPTISLLNTEERKHIDRTLERYSTMTAKQVSELSHMDMPWIAALPNEEIDYEQVFCRDEQTSIRERHRAWYTTENLDHAFETAVEKAISEKQRLGLPIARYDLKTRRAYLEFADGTREYVNG